MWHRSIKLVCIITYLLCIHSEGHRNSMNDIQSFRIYSMRVDVCHPQHGWPVQRIFRNEPRLTSVARPSTCCSYVKWRWWHVWSWPASSNRHLKQILSRFVFSVSVGYISKTVLWPRKEVCWWNESWRVLELGLFPHVSNLMWIMLLAPSSCLLPLEL